MSPLGDAKSDKTLEKYVEARGFAVVGGGRLPLYAQNIYAEGVEAAPKTVGEAPFVTFVQDRVRYTTNSTDVMTFDDTGKIVRMDGLWGPSDVTVG